MANVIFNFGRNNVSADNINAATMEIFAHRTVEKRPFPHNSSLREYRGNCL